MVINEWQDMIDLLEHNDVVDLANKMNIKIQGFSNLSKIPKGMRGRVVNEIKRRITKKWYFADVKKIPSAAKQDYDLDEFKEKIEGNKYYMMKLLVMYKVFQPTAEDCQADEIFKQYFYQHDIDFSGETVNDDVPQIPETTADDKVTDEAVEPKNDVQQDGQKSNKKLVKLEKENEELRKKLDNVSKDFKEKKKRVSDLEKQVKEQAATIKEKDKLIDSINEEKTVLQDRINELLEANAMLQDEMKYAQYPGIIIWVEEESEFASIKNIRRLVAVPSNTDDKLRIIETIKKYKIKEIWYVKSGHSFGESRRMKELAKELNVSLIDKRLREVR